MSDDGFDFSQALTTLDGKSLCRPSSRAQFLPGGEMLDPNPEEGEMVTLGAVCGGALMAELPGDRDGGFEKIMERGDLMDMIWKATKSGERVALSAEEVVLLKGRIAKSQPVLVAHRAIRILDPSASRPRAVAAPSKRVAA